MDNYLPVLADSAYRIESVLGSGGGGVVYKAWHERLQKYVVLKRIKDESTLIEPERYRGETDILKNLKHTYLPQLYDFLTDPSGIYTVMEFIPGWSFAEVMRDGRHYPQKQVIQWALQLSDALAYLHSQKPPVLHSDIKPGNIMLTPEGNVCLIDFNISLVLNGENEDVLGLSPGYASPEQYGPLGLPSDKQVATGGNQEWISDVTIAPGMKPAALSQQRREKIRMDTRSDIYSLGATLYHIATGEKPAISTGNIKPLSSFGLPFSEAFIYIIERCMKRTPSERFQTAAQLKQALLSIHRLDSRWKKHRLRGAVAAIIISTMFFTSSAFVFLGFTRMNSEKIETFNQLVLEIPNNIYAFEDAVALFPENPASYLGKARTLCQPGKYEECIEFISQSMAKLAAYPHNEYELHQIGEIYYLQGNAYLETADYQNAVYAYESAIENNPGHLDVYRDYAIALARSGYLEQAEEFLDENHDSGLAQNTINLSLVRGEIAFLRGEFDQAIGHFQNVIRGTDDNYILSRAYLVSEASYRRVPERTAEGIALLREGIGKLAPNYALALKERLAEALANDGQYSEAVAIFEELRLSGNLTYQNAQNIGVIYQQMGDFERARAQYDELCLLYPNDYRPLMRIAYLILEEQALLPNETRDYNEATHFYEQAEALCRTDDIEMLQLDALIEELKSMNWLH